MCISVHSLSMNKLVVCVLYLWLQGAEANTVRIPDEHRLLEKLMKKYESGARPVINASDSVVIEFGMTLIQIINMDEKHQVMAVNVWLEHGWVDQRIHWNPDEFGGLTMIRIPASRLWLPDIVLYNNADDYTTGYMPANAMVASSGYVFWSPPARLRSSCKVDISLFPFDVQKCALKFGSWSYEKAQVDMNSTRDQAELREYVINGEWELLNASMVRNEVKYPISDISVYPDVTVTFVIRRRVLYYTLHILFPCICLNVLSLLTFCLPPDSGEKITLGITVLLSYSVFMLLVADKMPPTSEFVPIIAIYLTVSMAVTSISCVTTVLVLKIHFASPNPKPVPELAKRLFFSKADCARARETSVCLGSRQQKESDFSFKRRSGKYSADKGGVSSRLLGDPAQKSPIHNGCHIGITTSNNNSAKRLARQESLSDDECIVTRQAKITPGDQMVKYLQGLVKKRELEEKVQVMSREWKLLAAKVDSFLFYFFGGGMVISTLLLLVAVPFSTSYN
ncbi:neuronal acetylcholine receptor subunit beta-3 [Lingula anatina]|uniref:Neuronal acetylcholine receptor subunit beta-3 n=1 Tax=Lingula anatina TaxID=7574 RepID=A0A1S3I3R3_LINAN|nr:neuronal acetylcholine receptor subunit beta-3 [Lingula anatina]|eukprot:XP_013392907.1 neuronal acetylcholine receptor subunit beta-3 [Lingula anatina]